MTRSTENDVMLNNEKKMTFLCLKMTWITENDIMLNNEKHDVPILKKVTRITENDFMPNNEKYDIPLPRKMTRTTENDISLPKKMTWITESDVMLNNMGWNWITLRKFRIAQTCLHDLGADKMTLQVLLTEKWWVFWTVQQQHCY